MSGAKIIGVSVIGETKWLRLESLKYIDRHGNERIWDRCVRTTQIAQNAIDAATSVAITPLKDGVLAVPVVCQFRPALGCLALEFPAGLVDNNGETVGSAAIRELKEETGYEGEIVHVSDRLVLSPGTGTESVAVVVVWCDPEKIGNQNPKAEMDPGEDIATYMVPLKGMRRALEKLAKEIDALVFDAVWTFALGLELGCHLDGLTLEKLRAVLG